MYGNFCGPYWSDGQFQSSVEPTLPAIDSLDETCREHDAVYARKGDLRAADIKFFRQNFGKGIIATAMAVPVGIQGVLRASDKNLSNQPNNQQTINTMAKKNLRGPNAKPKSQANDKKEHGASRHRNKENRSGTENEHQTEWGHRDFTSCISRASYMQR